MTYITEALPADSKLPNAHRHEIAARCGPAVGNSYIKLTADSVTNSEAARGACNELTHAVVNTDAHPLHRIVCYADRADAERIANALNAATPGK